jgi:hypothetical protein
MSLPVGSSPSEAVVRQATTTPLADIDISAVRRTIGVPCGAAVGGG